MSGIQQSFGFWSSGSSGQPTWISSLGSTVDAGASSLSTNFSKSAIDSSGNFYQIGYFGNNETGTADADIIMVKYNKSGIILWKRIITSISAAIKFDRGWGITVDSFGYIYICGTQATAQYTYSSTAWVAKYDSNGTYVWSKSSSSFYSNIALGFNDITTTASGDSFAVGFSSGLGSIWKLSYTGEIQWTTSIFSPLSDGNNYPTPLNKCTIDIDGNLCVVGYTTLSNGIQNLILVKVNGTTGAVIWQLRIL